VPQRPNYLDDRSADWRKDPHAANLEWFCEAGRGLFLHFSPASALAGGTGEWQALDTTYQDIHDRFGEYNDSEYEYWLDTLFTDVAIDSGIRAVWDRFRPDRFDADEIARLAVEAGMKYVTFTTRHVIGRMFLFETQTSPCHSVDLPPHRDFVRELADACAKRRLGLFLYVMAPYDDRAGRVQAMLAELLTHYGPIAGIWFDGIAQYYQRPDRFEDLSRTYRLVRSRQPACLISFKTGASGEEDFIAPEWHQCTLDHRGERDLGSGFRALVERQPTRTVTRYSEADGFLRRAERMADVWHSVLRHKPIEVCGTKQERNLWFNRDDARHLSLEEVMDAVDHARALGGNLLLNTGPLGDGSIHPRDRETLVQLGQRREDPSCNADGKGQRKKQR
jgi:alpha-L-fucosidase